MQRTDLETGTVISTDSIWATVITNKSKSCNECGKAQAGICGKSGSGMVMKARNTVYAKKGDTVELGLDKATHIKAYFFAFILPVICLMFSTCTGYIISMSYGIKDLDVLAGLSGLVISIFFSFKMIRKLDRTSRFQITRIISAPPECITAVSAEEMDYVSAFSKPG